MDKKLTEELRWIDEDIIIQPPPMVEEFPVMGQRTARSHIVKKLQDNLLVPFGLLATTACLTMGLVSLKRGDSARQQLFMRGRVGFQMFTLAAMVFGVILTTRKKSKKESGSK